MLILPSLSACIRLLPNPYIMGNNWIENRARKSHNTNVTSIAILHSKVMHKSVMVG